jgi:hypothetical protein
MRRTWRRLAAAALLLAVGLLAGWLAALSAATPELASSMIAGLLGRRVEIRELRVSVGRSLGVELAGLVVWDAAGEAPQLEVQRMHGSQRWPSLLAGQLLPLSWTAESPRLVLTSPKDGAEAGAAPSLSRLPLLGIEVQDGSVEWHRAKGEVVRVSGLRMTARRSGILGGYRGDAEGRVARGDAPAATFSGSFDGGPDGGRVDLRFSELDLEQLDLGAVPDPSGRAAGELHLRVDDAGFEARVEADAHGLRWPLPDLSGPIAAAECRVRLELSQRDGTLVVRPNPIALDDFVVRGELAWEHAREGRVRGELSLDDFQPGRRDRRLQLLRLIGLKHRSWTGFDARAEGGWLRGVRATFDLPKSGLGEALEFRRKLTAEELSITGVAEDGVWRPKPGDAPLERVTGEVRILGNVLELRGLQMAREGRPLPRMDIRVDGMHRLVHLPKAERQTPSGPGGPIPGLGPAFAAMGRAATPERPPTTLRVTEARVGYPAFVLPVRDASAQLSFPDGNLRVENGSGVYGGVPARFAAFWDRAAGTLSVDVKYDDGDAPPLVVSNAAPEQSWADGRLDVPTAYFGDWRVDELTGRFHGDGPRIEFREAKGRIAGGELGARGWLSLAEADSAPFEFVVDAVGAEAGGVGAFLGMSEGAVSGTLDADGTLAGRLAPERRFVEQADVRFDVRVRKGVLGRTPRTLVLARLLSPTGWTSLFGSPLAFDQIDFDASVRDGKFRTEEFTLEGPQLGAAAAGEIDLVAPERPTDMLLALLFFETVGGVLKQVPIVGNWMPGKDRSLFTVYVRLEGPWANPDGRLLPPDMIQTATGWAGRLIGGGVRRIVGMVTGGRPPATQLAAPTAGASDATSP